MDLGMLGGFAEYADAPAELTIQGGAKTLAADLARGAGEGRPVVLNLGKVDSISTPGIQVLLAAFKHHGGDITCCDASDDLIGAAKRFGADEKTLTWLRGQS